MELKRIIIAAALLLAVVPCAAYADEYAEDWQAEQPQTINAYDGIYQYGDRLETYYSSEVAYHWQTPEWWVDDQGFYRTADGYYVVAASDMEQGTVFEGSMGTCQVLDCGCDYGITDYYVNWM